MESNPREQDRLKRILFKFYNHLDFISKMLAESAEDAMGAVLRSVGKAMGFLLQSLFSFWTYPRGCRFLSLSLIRCLLQGAVGVTLLVVVYLVSLILILIAGTFSGVLGLRNYVFYSFKEEVAAWAFLILLALSAPLFLTEYWLFKLSLMFCFALIVLGLDFLYGQCGILSLGQAGFVMIGAYVTAVLHLESFAMKLPITLAILVGGVISFLLGILLGFPSLRIKDYYLVIITMVFSQIIPILLKSKHLVDYTGLKSGGGLALEPQLPPALLKSLSVVTWNYYYVLTVSMFLVVFAYNLLRHSQYGRAFRTIRCDVEVSTVFGIPVVRYKLFAFALSAFYAAVAGGLLFYLSRFISPDSYGNHDTINYIIAAVVGGPGSIFGSFVGGAFLAFEEELTKSLSTQFSRAEELARIFYGVILILSVYFAPRGIAGELVARIKALFLPKPVRGSSYMYPAADYDYVEAKILPVKAE